MIERMRAFIRERFADRPQLVSLREADKYGYVWEEYERLKLRGSPHFLAVRAALRVGGRLSKGIGLGWQSGFDSGRSLDYVYENRPQGSSRLGKFIDANYLNSIGWRGIRQRKANLEGALRDAIEKLQSGGAPDPHSRHRGGRGSLCFGNDACAAGHLDQRDPPRQQTEKTSMPHVPSRKSSGLQNVTVGLGDAFDRAALAAFAPRATIGVVSGLYELFPSNDAVLESLGGLAGAIEPGGYLIYTNQPWHPQLEFIARVLRNREGQAMDHAPADHGRDRRVGAERGFREMRDGNRSLGNVYRRGRAPHSLLKTDTSVSRGRALAASAGLSLLFLLVYGACLWVTARRGDVGVFYFAWERAIPFVPFMILPYMSIDLFFVAAPFLFPRSAGAQSLRRAGCERDRSCGHLFPRHAASLRLSTTACRGLAGCASSIGSAGWTRLTISFPRSMPHFCFS